MPQKQTPLPDCFEIPEEDLTYKLTDFPMATQNETMPIDEFLDLPNFPINRDVEHRANKAVTRFAKLMHKHAEVDLLLYTGDTVKDPAIFMKDQLYILDGNTRHHVWKKHYRERQIVNSNIKKLAVPKEVSVRVYEVDNVQTACNLYYIIDSADAVETKQDKITGAFRAENILDKLTNTKLKRGVVGTALNIAAPYGPKNDHRTPGVNDLIDQVACLKDQIVWMDKCDAVGRGHFKQLCTTGVAMLAGKLTDCSEDWQDAVIKLSAADYAKNDPTVIDSLGNSALQGLVRGNIMNPVVDKPNTLPYGIGFGQAPALVRDYLAYCWMAYLQGKDVKDTVTDAEITGSYFNMWSNVYLNHNII